MKKYFITSNEDYAQNWVVEADTEEAAVEAVSAGKGHRVGEMTLVESCVDAFAHGEIDEEQYAEYLEINKAQPRPYLDPDERYWLPTRPAQHLDPDKP